MTEENKNRIAAINIGIIPKDYKKTKVGIVPVEWEMIKLNNISRHITEKNKDMKYNETYTNSATQGIIKQTDYFDKQISNADNIDGYYIVRQNDYVYNPRISVSAPCGPISKSHFSETGIMSPLYTVFRLNDEYGNNDYIEHYFKSSFWHRYMSSVANYGVRHDRMNITNEDLFNMPIPFPPLPEQQKIAEILSTQDKLIELYERKIEQLKTLKKGYLQKMFPKKGCKYPELRFKGFTDPWEQRKVGEVLIERNEQFPKSEEYPLMAFIANEGVAPKGERYDRSALVNDTENKLYKRTEYDDFIYSSNNLETGSIGLNKYGKATISPVYSIFESTGIADSDFLGRRLVRKDFINEMVRWRQGVIYGQWKIHEADFVKIEINVPSVQEQRKIGLFLDNLDRLITLHQHKLDKEKQKKKALMQLLLTGKVRVST